MGRPPPQPKGITTRAPGEDDEITSTRLSCSVAAYECHQPWGLRCSCQEPLNDYDLVAWVGRKP